MSPRINSSNWSVNDQITAARLQDLNEDLDDIYTLGNDRGRVRTGISGTALRIDIAAFAWRVGSTNGQYAGGTDIVVTNTATNYVEIDSSGTIQINTSTWTTGYGRLATVTCSGGVVTAISIWKADLVGGELGGNSPTVLDKTGDYTITSSDVSKFITNNGASGAVILTLPTPAATYYFTIACSAAQSLTVIVGNTSTHTLYDGEVPCTSIFTDIPESMVEIIFLTTTRWGVRSKTGQWLDKVVLPTIANTFFTGGDNDASAVQSDIRKLQHSDESASTLAATLDTGRVGPQAVSSTTNAYIGGGYNGGAQAIISKLVFSGETEANLAATLDTARYNACGQGFENSVRGYFAGGTDGGSRWGYIDRMVFADDTSVDIGTTLASYSYGGASVQSASDGYVLGGTDKAGTRTAVCSAMRFYSEITRLIGTQLLTATQFYTGRIQSQTAGYTMGGSTGSRITTINKFTFFCEKVAVIAATLDTASQEQGSNNGNTKGYVGGGNQSGGYTDDIEYMNVTNDTSAAIAAALAGNRRQAVGAFGC